MALDTRHILEPDISVSAACVRVPVSIGQAEAINLAFERPITEAQARAALKSATGISVLDHRVDEGYVTPQESAGEDPVFVSRIPRDPPGPHRLRMWGVAGKLRKGAPPKPGQNAGIPVRHYLPYPSGRGAGEQHPPAR